MINTYVYVKSNDNIDIFKRNKTNDFQVLLTKYMSVDIAENVEIALCEISIPFTFYNITNENNVIYIKSRKKTKAKRLEIAHGFYDIKTFIKKVNEYLKNNSLLTRFSFNPCTAKVSVYIWKNESVLLNDYLKYMLGFEKDFSDDNLYDIASQKLLLFIGLIRNI